MWQSGCVDIIFFIVFTGFSIETSNFQNATSEDKQTKSSQASVTYAKSVSKHCW